MYCPDTESKTGFDRQGNPEMDPNSEKQDPDLNLKKTQIRFFCMFDDSKSYTKSK